jgi:hypothetical protein
LVFAEACNWRTTGGQETVVNPAGTTVLTFGLDSLLNPLTSCPVNGANYYYKAYWFGSGTGDTSFTARFPYFSYH